MKNIDSFIYFTVDETCQTTIDIQRVLDDPCGY